MLDISKKNLIPFLLTALVITLDQLSKAFIVANWPVEGTLIKDVFNNEFLFMCHVRNKAIAFSLGENIPQQFRYLLFVIVPVAVLVFLVWYYFATAEFSKLQRWAIAGIVGGGLGNIIDRVAREDGVVDFISVKFYGFLGMERWPTFNIADSSVVVCCLILLVTLILPRKMVVVEEIAAIEAAAETHRRLWRRKSQWNQRRLWKRAWLLQQKRLTAQAEKIVETEVEEKE